MSDTLITTTMLQYCCFLGTIPYVADAQLEWIVKILLLDCVMQPESFKFNTAAVIEARIQPKYICFRICCLPARGLFTNAWLFSSSIFYSFVISLIFDNFVKVVPVLRRVCDMRVDLQDLGDTNVGKKYCHIWSQLPYL